MTRFTSLAATLLATTLLTPALFAADPAPKADADQGAAHSTHDAHAHGDGHRDGHHHGAADVTLSTEALAAYGDFGFDPGTVVPAARESFARGLAMLWGFNHAGAITAFRTAQEADPTCSACYWGEAYALGPNLNDGMHDENTGRAAEAAALARGRAVSPRDRMLAAALVARYDSTLGDRAAQDAAFAEAMDQAAARLPGNANVQVILADALMNLQPWDYWEADRTPKGRTADILAALERAMALDPDHPGALHLWIHALEAAHPERAEEAADRLRGAVPISGHLLHMPAHIYNRLGRWEDSIAVNRDAVAADAAYIEREGDAASDIYQYGYVPHNMHFLLVAAQMSGRADLAIEAAGDLARMTSDDVSEDLGWVQAIDTATYAVHAQMAEPETILALPDPGDRFPYIAGHWHWARATAFAATGDIAAARQERDALAALLEGSDFSALEAQYLPARDVLSIALHVTEARIAQAEGNWPLAERHLEAAIGIEATIGYMEPPYWSYPVSQTLGAVRLQAGNAAGAATAFEAALESHPNNAFALWGLWQAEDALAVDQGDAGRPFAARRAFERAWLGSGEPELSRL